MDHCSFLESLLGGYAAAAACPEEAGSTLGTTAADDPACATPRQHTCVMNCAGYMAQFVIMSYKYGPAGAFELEVMNSAFSITQLVTHGSASPSAKSGVSEGSGRLKGSATLLVKQGAQLFALLSLLLCQIKQALKRGEGLDQGELASLPAAWPVHNTTGSCEVAQVAQGVEQCVRYCGRLLPMSGQQSGITV
jgi:hypothetical protein